MDSNSIDKNNLVKVSYNKKTARFFYEGLSLSIDDKCIVETSEGVEYGTVIGFDKLLNKIQTHSYS